MFTTKAIVYLSMSLSLLTLALLLDDFQIGILVLGIASLLFLSNVWGLPEKVEVKLERNIVPYETFGDENVRVESRVTNQTRSTLGNSEIREYFDHRISPDKGSERTLVTIPSLQEISLGSEFQSLPRAIYEIGPLTFEVRDPFGFYLIEKKLPADTLFVLPRPDRLTGIEIRPRHVGPWPGQIPSRILGNGTEFYSLREYTVGDDSKRINWKASARYGKLIINEAEAERVTDIMIVLDTDVSFFGLPGEELFEQEVRAAASIVRQFLRNGNRVGLVLQGGERGSVPAGFGKRHEKRLLYLLAAAKPGKASVSTSYVMNLLARRMVPSRAQVVIISPLLDSEMKEGVKQLTIAGYSLLVLSPTPTMSESFQNITEKIAFKMILLERAITLIALEKTASVLDWPAGIPLSTMISKVRRTRHTIRN